MSKSKSDVKASKASKDVLTKVKAGSVTKPAKTEKAQSKELAKQVAAKEDKKSKKQKKVKEPTPEPSSESEEEDSSSESESEVETKKPATKAKTNGVSKAAPAEDSDDSDESDSSESSEDEAPAPKANGSAKINGHSKAVKKDVESDSESDESDSSEDEKPVTTKAAKADSSDESESDEEESDSNDSDSEAEEPKKAVAAQKTEKAKAAADSDASDASESDSSESDSSEESDDEEVEEEESKQTKRKADVSVEPASKKAKTEDDDVSKKTLFVGNLSWNVDEAWLKEVFEEFGELAGVRLMTDRATGRSKGFGYVEFVSAKDSVSAHAAKQGADLDGRPLNVDFSNPRPDQGQKQDNRRKSYGDSISEPTDTLFLGNLAFDVGQEQVTEAFSPYGTILGVRLPTDRETGAPKGFGYVNFASVDEAAAALEAMQGAYIENRPIRLDYSQPRPQNNDSPGGRGRGGFGGGFGGRGGGGRGGGRGGRGGSFGGGRGGSFGGGRGGRGGGRGGFSSTNRGGFGDFSGRKQTFDE